MSTMEAIAHLPERYGKLTTPSQASIVLLIAVVMSTLVGIAGFNNVYQTALEERALASKAMVESAVNTTWFYYNQFMAGKITAEQAKEASLSVIGHMHYGDGNYVFAYSFDKPREYILLVNKVRPDLVGTNRYDAASPDGVKYVQAGVNVAKAGGGYYSYHWNAGGTTDQARQKQSYASQFEPWRWMIGTGSYVDDIVSSLWDKVFGLLTFAGMAVAVGVSFITWLHRWGVRKNVDRLLQRRRLS